MSFEIITDDELLKFTATQQSQYLVDFQAAHDDIRDLFRNGTQIQGYKLPWMKTHELFRFRPGEVSIWAGINGHGKSMLQSHIAAHLAKESKVCIASLEMKVAATGHRMLRQIGGTSNPTDLFIQKMIDWTKGKIWIYDETGSVNPDRVLGLCHYCAEELAINNVFIDSLVKCGIGVDDYPKQKDFMDSLCWAAKRYNIHIHLVHHMRKGESEEKIPDKFSVKGAGELVDLVDNLVIVHRNKKKEAKVASGESIDDLEPDTYMVIGKQRHGEWEGKIALYFHKDSQQFLSGPESRLEHWQI